MKISHGQLDACVLTPRLWYESIGTAESHPYPMGYGRALAHAIFHFHKSSDADARDYLARMIRRHDFKNAARVAQITEDLEAYMNWAAGSSVRVAGTRVRIAAPCGFLELRGEISRVDVTEEGYRAVMLGTFPSNWKTQLRMPLIQSAIALYYQRPVDEVEVGFQLLNGGNLETIRYRPSQIDAAQRKFRALGRIIRRLSRP